jgi:phosphoribosylformylglycinamidine synthase
VAAVKALVLRAVGTNCDRETVHALAMAGAHADHLHINRLRDAPARLCDYQLLALPGGFSYGDDLGAGRVHAIELRHFLADAIRGLLDRGGLILGICNGFQVLVQSGLLPGRTDGDQTVTLAGNAHGRFESRWVSLEVTTERSPWLNAGDRLELPIAHGEGRFVARDPETLEALGERGQLALRYVAPDGGPAGGFPANPNGSALDIAGICDPTGRILGLMPHPERNVLFHHHPCWTRRDPSVQEPCGLRLFRNAVRHLQS